MRPPRNKPWMAWLVLVVVASVGLWLLAPWQRAPGTEPGQPAPTGEVVHGEPPAAVASSNTQSAGIDQEPPDHEPADPGVADTAVAVPAPGTPHVLDEDPASDPRLRGRWTPGYEEFEAAKEKLDALADRVDLGGSSAAETLAKLKTELARTEIRFTKRHMLTLRDGQLISTVGYAVRESSPARLVLHMESGGELVVQCPAAGRLRLLGDEGRPLPLVRLPG